MAELKVLGAGPVKRGVTQVAALFEKSSGHRVHVEFVGAPLVRDRILAGEAVDVAIVPAATMDEFVAAGKVVTESRARLGRSRMGLAMRKGAVAPALSTAEDFRQMVAAADAVVVNVASSGNYVVKLIEKLGFSAEQKSIRQPDAVIVMDYVAASTKNLLGAGQLPEIRELIDKGVAIELAGALPDELQSITAYDAAVPQAGANAGIAASFTAFFATPAARAAMAATGID